MILTMTMTLVYQEGDRSRISFELFGAFFMRILN